MSVTQTFRNSNGTLIHRKYKDKKPGRPKGVKNSTYNLSEEGRKTKQKVMRALVTRLRAEGRTGWPKGVPQSIEHRRKNSEGVRHAILEGRHDPCKALNDYLHSKDYEPRSFSGKHGTYFSVKNNKYLRYDSSWELTRMKCFERDTKVKSYKKNPLRLVYTLKGTVHYYYPDFLITYVNGDKVLEEIKPIGLAKLPVAKAKFLVALVYCKSTGKKFRVIDCKSDLKQKGYAIVRSHTNKKYEKLAEMTNSGFMIIQ